MLKPGAKNLEIAAKDPLLAGADGLAFGEKTILYVNSVTAGKLLRLDLGPDGKSKSVVELKLSRPLDRPDGMRAIGKNRLLLAENSGKMDIVTFEGSGLQNARDQDHQRRTGNDAGVTATRGMAWIVEGKLPLPERSGVQGQRSRAVQNVRGSAAEELTSSAKRKREGLRSRIEKLDLEGAILNGALLTNELVQTLIRDLPVSLRVGIHSVIHSRRLAVNRDPEANRLSVRPPAPAPGADLARGNGRRFCPRAESRLATCA